MSERKVTILTGEPTIEVIAHMQLSTTGLERMARWVKEHRPECMPDDYNNWTNLFPHHEMLDDHNPRSHNELLVELAGRKCYDSFGLKAGKKTNKEYIGNTQAGDVPHSSILYHAKMSFFFAGISRRVSHEIIRNYVGADRDEEGSPSQESTRFTHHYGFFIMPPRYLGPRETLPRDDFGSPMAERFQHAMQTAYDFYLGAVEAEVDSFTALHGKAPTGIEKKRIYEAASSFLPHQAETSMIWTTNPMAIAKFCRERDNEHADLEIQRFAHKWKKLCVECWPNLFPQPWMRE